MPLLRPIRYVYAYMSQLSRHSQSCSILSVHSHVSVVGSSDWTFRPCLPFSMSVFYVHYKISVTHDGVLKNPAYMDDFGNPTSNAQGAIVASMPAGSFAGALLVTYLADKIGRKKTVISSGWIWVIGCILQCAAQASHSTMDE